MKITEDHWLEPVTRIPLAGGASMPVRRFLVIHHTAGATGRSSIDYWKHLANGVCAHFVIERDGEIIQCRPCNLTCGHAGPSKWAHDGVNYNGLNKCSIGIELANGGSTFPSKFSDIAPKYARHKHGGPSVLWEVYPAAQLKACFELSRVLVARYKLDDIVGHEDIAPERKTDPGPLFPMARLRAESGFTHPL